MRSSLSLRCCEHQTCTSAGARFRRLLSRARLALAPHARRSRSSSRCALSTCSWDLMPRHLCGRSILSDGASPPAAPSLFGWHRICVCAILAVAGDCFWAAVHDGRRPRLPRLWRSRGRLSSATTASYTWRPGAVAPQPTLGAAVASRLVACFSFLSGPAGDKLCCHVALGDLYPRQHSGTCSARATAHAALRVSLVSLFVYSSLASSAASWAAWRAGGCLCRRLV